VGDQAQRFRDATEQIRQRTERTAKALGGLGTTAVAAIGIAKFADVFPWAPGQWYWVAILIASFLAMVAVVGYFTYRLWHVSEHIVLRSDADRMTDLSPQERERVRAVYEETASLDRAPSLSALEARAHRFYRIADRTTDQNAADKLIKRANDIVADIRSVEARAGMIIVRRRAAEAIRSWTGIAAYAALALAIIAFGISADRLDSERTQLVKLVQDCAAAKKATQVGGLRTLPRICRGSSKKVASPTKDDVSVGQPSVEVTLAKGATERVQAGRSALHEAAGLASALAPLGATTAAQAAEGKQLLEDFLQGVGFPLAKAGISRVASSIWDRFAVAKPPPLPEELVVPPQRLRIEIVRVRTPTFFDGLAPQRRYQTIKLTVIVRDRRPRVQIIRVPIDPDG
jgi:hypothetical protein